MEEIWKDIEGYEELYQVSNFGNVKSLNYNKTRKEKILKPAINGVGYYQVILSKNGKKKTFRIHKLVVMTFLNHQPDGTHNIVVNHIDNNKLNNHVNNLELVSNRYNSSCHKNNPGVYEHENKKNKKFRVQIWINNQCIHIGYYETIEEANRVYQLATSNVHLYNGDNKEFRELIKTLYHV